MSDIILGRLISVKQERDAIHVAILPVIASETLNPGQKICFSEGHMSEVRAADDSDVAIGIVDPFLERAIAEGQEFWAMMMPGSVESLRHNWKHPLVGDNDEERYVDPYGSDECGC